MSREREGRRALELVAALRRVREVEFRRARADLAAEMARVAAIEREVARLRKRRESLLLRSGPDVLGERLFLAELTRVQIERGRELAGARRGAARILAAYREAHARKQAAAALLERRQIDREAFRARREEEAAGDVASWRISARGAEGRDEG
jgi:hypothetical protein